MTTLQEAARKALEALESMRKIDTDEAIKDLRTALAQQVERKNCPQPEICGSKECEFCRDTAAPAQKPVAYITDTWQGPMVWTPEMYNDACTYCDDGEFPVPLYTAAPACQVDRLQMLVEQVKKAHELAKIMKDFADKNPESLMLKELDK